LISTDYNKVVVAATLEARRMVASDNYIRDMAERFTPGRWRLIYYSYFEATTWLQYDAEVKDKSGKVVKVRRDLCCGRACLKAPQGNCRILPCPHGRLSFSGGSFNVPGRRKAL
jgi:hypothetical protein